jgi:hypothetical protein
MTNVPNTERAVLFPMFIDGQYTCNGDESYFRDCYTGDMMTDACSVE